MPDRPANELPDRERGERNPEERRDWEPMQVNEGDKTERLRIAGGWLYRTITDQMQVAMVFVPASDAADDASG